jgi:hypothetical protein
MMLYDALYRRHDNLKNDVDIDVPLTTVPQKAQQQSFREIRLQISDKSGFLFPLVEVNKQEIPCY